MKRKIFLLLIPMLQVICLTGIADAEQNILRVIDVQTLMSDRASAQKPIVVDAGSLLACLDAKIPGALCLPCEGGERNPSFFASLPKGEKIIFYTSYQPLSRDCRLIREVHAAGFRNLYLLQGGLEAWRKAGNPVASERRIPRVAASAVKPRSLAQWQKKVKNPLLIDIRSPEAFAAGHLDGAVNFPLSGLHVQYADIPLDRTLLVVDEDGRAGFLAASYLARKGFMNVSRLQGGMANIKRGVQ